MMNNAVSYFLILIVVVPVHYGIYRLVFKRKQQMTEVTKLFLSELVSIFALMLMALLVFVLPVSLRGGFASTGGDLTILPVMMIVIYTFVFALLYTFLVSLSILIRKYFFNLK